MTQEIAKQDSSKNDKTDHKSFHALITAAGSGIRMGTDKPKQYLSLCGKPILRHTIETFLSCPGLKSIHIIINEEHMDMYNAAVEGLNLPDPIIGSNERKLSIYNGLKNFSKIKNKEIILLHDAVRPFVCVDKIVDVINAAHKYKAATLALPVADTLRNESNYIDRDGLWSIQTPQGFEYGLIKSAHDICDPTQNFTDDSAMVEATGTPVQLIKGSKTNFKITTMDDFKMAKDLLTAQYADIRTGQGFDVHAFDTKNPGPTRIGGIDIPHDHALKGHSDADVALHAITDAILGAIGQGDIGQHFPPSDESFKGMDSAIFLKKAMKILDDHQAILKNIDLTIICEAPKIGPHAAAMKTRIAAITLLDKTRINIKATTTEQLGFTGRGEGIAAQAIATIACRD